MPQIFRAYVPTVRTTQQSFYQQSLATAQASPLLKSAVDPTLPHRKIWAFLWSITASVSINWDLVATLNSREVFRMQMSRFSGITRLFSVGFNSVGTNIGGIGEPLFVNVATSTLYSVSPLRLNISADTFYIDSTPGLAGAGSLWDAYLFTMSQAGI